MKHYPTPEAAHDALMDAIEYELEHYGPASLADMVASIASSHRDEDDPKPTDAEWVMVEKAFEQTAEQLVRLSISQRKR